MRIHDSVISNVVINPYNAGFISASLDLLVTMLLFIIGESGARETIGLTSSDIQLFNGGKLHLTCIKIVNVS